MSDAPAPPDGPPRIAPGRLRDIGVVNGIVVGVVGLATGTGRLNLFSTLARHRRLFRPWLRFAARLMPSGTLPRTDTELIILRVAGNCGCHYEWQHHLRLARRAGLGDAEIGWLIGESGEPHWTDRQRALLAAADQLHTDRRLDDQVWAELSRWYTERQLIELCLLVGHYEMLAMTISSLRISIEPRWAVDRSRS